MGGNRFLDEDTSLSSSSSGQERSRAATVMRNVDEVCKDMRQHLSLQTNVPRSIMHEQVHTMSELQRQVMDRAAFILKHEAALVAAGLNLQEDGALAMMREELGEVREQVKRLRTEMKASERVPTRVGRGGRGGSRSMALSVVATIGSDEEELDNAWEDEEGLSFPTHLQQMLPVCL